MLPEVHIISVNFRKAEVTCDMLDTLRQITYPNYRVTLVDNGALQDDKALFESHHPGIEVIISEENLGFAGGNNLAIGSSPSPYLLLLNNDTLVPPDFLEPLVQVLENDPSIGLVSPKIFYHDQPGILQYAGTGTIDPFTGRGRNLAKHRVDDGTFDHTREVELAHGACMLVRQEVFKDIGLLAEDYFMYYEELDFCMRARRKGWKIYYTGASHLVHRESSSMGRFNPLKTYYLFRNRWLFMRRFGTGWSYVCFVVYFLLIGVPLNTLRFAWKRELDHVKALWRGVLWNFTNV